MVRTRRLISASIRGGYGLAVSMPRPGPWLSRKTSGFTADFRPGTGGPSEPVGVTRKTVVSRDTPPLDSCHDHVIPDWSYHPRPSRSVDSDRAVRLTVAGWAFLLAWFGQEWL